MFQYSEYAEKVTAVYELVQRQFEHESADHDFQHILRVYRMSQLLQKSEGGDRLIIELAALLHDISDHKLNGGILDNNGKVSREILTELMFPEDVINAVVDVVDKVSFKGANVEDEVGTIELQIVRDADRLDAIGAIGIARAFHFGGARNRKLHSGEISTIAHESFDAYRKADNGTLNHFYEKLFLLKDRMHTQTARKIAEERHQLMEQFVAAFLKDWYIDEK